MPEWQLDGRRRLHGDRRARCVVEDLAGALDGLAAAACSVAALLVMAVVLALVFRSRLRLLPLAVALAAVALDVRR